MKNIFLLVILLGAAGSLRAQDEWPQFRGPGGSGISPSKGLPVTWSEEKNIRWKTAIHGRAWSSPVVWGNQVWLTTASPEGRELYAVCVDRETGKVLRDEKLFEVTAPQFAHKFNTYGSPSPAIEKGRVYITFGSPGTACLDTATGKKIWERRDLECNHFRGAGSSPVIFEDLLLMNFDGSDFQFVIALEKKTGRTVWRTRRSIDFQDITPEGKVEADGDWRKGFSTPHIAQWEGQPMMVSLGSKATYGYNPRTGRELWRVEDRKNHSGSATPTSGLGMIFTCTGLSRGQLWAFKPSGTGLLEESNIVWKVTRNVPSKPSVLLVGDLLYMVDDGGVASCVEARTGADVWRERVGGNFSASPLHAAGKIYFFNEEGKATVIEAGRTFKILAQNSLGDGFMATPAIAGKALFLRSRSDLYRVEE